MSAQATFFYGVFVKSAYLCFASDAYKEVKNSLLSIDLICARRRKGSLSTGGFSDIVGRVPEEVWKMIKLQISDEGTHEAEQRSLAEFIASPRSDCGTSIRWEDLDATMEALNWFCEQGGTSNMVTKRLEVALSFCPRV